VLSTIRLHINRKSARGLKFQLCYRSWRTVCGNLSEMVQDRPRDRDVVATEYRPLKTPPHQQQCRSNIRLCRINRSTCSIRQCCFDIVADVGGASQEVVGLYLSNVPVSLTYWKHFWIGFIVNWAAIDKISTDISRFLCSFCFPNIRKMRMFCTLSPSFFRPVS